MENKHIELVKKWLADKNSVSQEELEISSAEACDTAADAANVWRAAWKAWKAADAAANAANAAAGAACVAENAADPDAALANESYYAADWVRDYEEMTNVSRET